MNSTPKSTTVVTGMKSPGKSNVPLTAVVPLAATVSNQKEKNTIVEGVSSQGNTGITPKANQVEEQKGKNKSLG